EDEDRDHLVGFEMAEGGKINPDDDADEDFQDQDELALRDEIGLARLIDELGDFLHGGVDRKLFDLGVNHQAEDQDEAAHGQALEKEIGAVHAEEHLGRQVGEDQFGLARHRPQRQKNTACKNADKYLLNPLFHFGGLLRLFG